MSRRFYVGNLFGGVGEADLEKLFSKFGRVGRVEIKTKKDVGGNVLTTFAFVTVNDMAESAVSQCIAQYNNLKWKNNTIRVQQAQDSFLTRLHKEHEVCNNAKPEKPEIESNRFVRSSPRHNKIVRFSDDEGSVSEASPEKSRLARTDRKRVYHSSSSDDDSDDGSKKESDVMSKLESFNSGFWKDSDEHERPLARLSDSLKPKRPKISGTTSRERDKNLTILDSVLGRNTNPNMIPVPEKGEPAGAKHPGKIPDDAAALPGSLPGKSPEELREEPEFSGKIRRYDPDDEDQDKFKPEAGESAGKPESFWMSSGFSKSLSESSRGKTGQTFSLLSKFSAGKVDAEKPGETGGEFARNLKEKAAANSDEAEPFFFAGNDARFAECCRFLSKTDDFSELRKRYEEKRPILASIMKKKMKSRAKRQEKVSFGVKNFKRKKFGKLTRRPGRPQPKT